jgi:PTH1 family peptidyl-tRNA hydrolase
MLFIAMPSQFLIVGLGNPGAEYARQRHNVGFLAVDALAASCGPLNWQGKFHGQFAAAQQSTDKLLFLKPQTFMNRSGLSVGAACAFYKIPPEQVIVLHDDLDLPSGKIRIKRGGGHGGHNGLKSCDAAIGANYKRIRLGIGHPGTKELVTGYVLGDFTAAERDFWATVWPHLSDALPLILADRDAEALNRLAPPPVRTPGQSVNTSG